MKTIKSILEEMKKAVEEEQIISPTAWLNWALELNTLQQDLETELTKAEINYKREINELLEADPKLSMNKAELKVQSKLNEDGTMTSYEFYKYLNGRSKLITEQVRLAKKRAVIEDNFN